MLLFITARNRDRLCYWVSIHLMLLFIFRLPCVTSPLKRVSIHLMLLFIDDIICAFEDYEVFQYISCYSLSSIHLTTTLISEVSIHLMLLFINNRNIMECKEICFNTSHVTLYRFKNIN